MLSKSPNFTAICQLTQRVVVCFFFFLCCMRKKTCGPVTKRSTSNRNCSNIFLEKNPEGGEKHLFPMFIMLWNEMQNGEWSMEGHLFSF